jgi:hypothetical protein
LYSRIGKWSKKLLCGGPIIALAGAGLPQSFRLEETEFIRLGDAIRFRGVAIKQLANGLDEACKQIQM